MMAIVLAAILQATIPMRPIDKGVMSQMDDSRLASARSVAEWSKLWNLHAGERTRPAVDFSKEVVVGVFLGTRPTAGFSMEIVGVRVEGAALVVSYKETRPAPDSVAAQVLTSPFHIVAVPKGATTDVKFERVN
jgi:protease stability complex PrcB-like protein